MQAILSDSPQKPSMAPCMQPSDTLLAYQSTHCLMAYTLRTSSAHKQAILAPMEIWCTWKKWNAFTLSTMYMQRARQEVHTHDVIPATLSVSWFWDSPYCSHPVLQTVGRIRHAWQPSSSSAWACGHHDGSLQSHSATPSYREKGGRQMQNGRQETARLAEQQNFNAGRQATLCTSTAAKMRKNLDLRRT